MSFTAPRDGRGAAAVDGNAGSLDPGGPSAAGCLNQTLMNRTSILTTEQLDEFHRRGILRIPDLFSAGRIRGAREYVQRRLARLGLWKDGAWCLDAIPRPEWPNTGLKSAKAIGNRHPEVEALLDEPAVTPIVETLLYSSSPLSTRSSLAAAVRS